MKRRDYSRKQHELSSMVIDFAIEHDIPSEFILRMLVETSQAYVERFDETKAEWAEQERLDREMEEEA